MLTLFLNELFFLSLYCVLWRLFRNILSIKWNRKEMDAFGLGMVSLYCLLMFALRMIGLYLPFPTFISIPLSYEVQDMGIMYLSIEIFLVINFVVFLTSLWMMLRESMNRKVNRA